MKPLVFILALLACPCLAQDRVSVLDYGAVPSDNLDDYDAIKRAAAAISGKELVFPRGVYLIDQYTQEGEPSRDIEWRGSDFRIIGEHAIISVKGDFHRNVIPGTRRSDKYAVIPFEFINCERFSIEGIIVDGNVRETTRAPGISTVTGHGFLFRGCSDYRIENVTVRNTAGDGVYLGGGSENDTNAVLVNVTCRNNARQGLTIGHLRGGRIEGCEFSNSGRVGDYGGESPRAGVDIEPSRDLAEPTGDIVFTDCRIHDNLGCQFVCEAPSRVENVTLSRCKIVAAPDSLKTAVLVGFPGATIEDCEIDVGRGAIYPNYHGGTTTIRRNRIRTCGAGILSTGDGELLIEDNEIIGYHDKPMKAYIPHLNHAGAVFTGNTIYIPKQMYFGSGRTRVAALVQECALVRGNTFVSNLDDGRLFLVSIERADQVEENAFFRFGVYGGK